MDKFTFFRRVIEEHVIDDGRVGCPMRKCDVDIESCAACGCAISIDFDARPPVVRCRPPSVPRPGMC